jgi:hypothetical protein
MRAVRSLAASFFSLPLAGSEASEARSRGRRAQKRSCASQRAGVGGFKSNSYVPEIYDTTRTPTRPSLRDGHPPRARFARGGGMKATFRFNLQTANVARIRPHLRDAISARMMSETLHPRITEGVGNAGCPSHPQPRVENKTRELVTARTTGNHPAFPHANGFNGFLRALPRDRLDCLCRQRDAKASSPT